MTKIEKIYSGEKFYIFFDQHLQFTRHFAYINDVQATGGAFSPQKRTSSTSKLEIFEHYFLFFTLPDPEPAD
jgi:hypothetical protein